VSLRSVVAAFRGQHQFHFDFMGRRRLWLLISTTLLVVSILGLVVQGLNLGIDFRGGALLSFPNPTNRSVEDVRETLARLGHPEAVVQLTGEGNVRVRMESLGRERARVLDALAEDTEIEPGDISVEDVGPKWGAQISAKALQGLVIFLVSSIARVSVERLSLMILPWLAVSLVVFVTMEATTNPVQSLAPGVTQEDVQRQREFYGLDKPAHERYFTSLGNFVTGDLGISLQTRREVWPELYESLRNTLQLAAVAFTLYVVAGIAIGTFAALRHRSAVDQTATGFAFLALSVPQFLLGLVLIIVVGIYFENWLGGNLSWISDRVVTSNGTRFDMWSYERMWALLLPALTVAAQQLAVYSRYMRSSMLEVMSQDYLLTARAKGVSERRVVVRHAMRNALIPMVTLSAVDLATLTSGLIVTEVVFEWHGMGRYFLDTFQAGDTARVMPWAMIVALAVVIFNLIADLLYGVLDPRVRHD
jgi:peptide/nickel transport system permease protein